MNADIARGSEDLDTLRARVTLSTSFAWMLVSGLSGIAGREHGEVVLNDLWRRLMSSEQNTRFVEALTKLGITEGSPATVAARYHYLSNSIGGIRMHYVEESPKKVWIRYLAPWGSFPGISALLVAPSVRRTILSTWHPRNGELLGCPRLGWVATKFISEGHAYDEGYFLEYDHDLKPEERFRVETVASSPEFDPAKAPRLDPVAWPEARVLKGSHSYGADYAGHLLEIMENMFGPLVASQLVERGLRMLAVQYTADLAGKAGVTGNGPDDIAELAAAILRSFRNEVTCTVSGNKAEVSFSRVVPFQAVRSREMRAALFAFFSTATQMLNGHVRATRHLVEDRGIETWTFADEGRWLW